MNESGFCIFRNTEFPFKLKQNFTSLFSNTTKLKL